MSFCATSAAPTASESVRQWPTAFVPQKSIQRPKPIQFKNPELDSGSERRQVMMERFLILTETDKRLLLLPLSLLLRNLKWNQWKQKKKKSCVWLRRETKDSHTHLSWTGCEIKHYFSFSSISLSFFSQPPKSCLKIILPPLSWFLLFPLPLHTVHYLPVLFVLSHHHNSFPFKLLVFL